jgi:hypothetical protein
MAADGSQDDTYFALKKGQAFIDGARQAERNWLYTAQDRGIWRLWWLIYCQVLGIDPITGEYNTNQQLRVVGEQANYTSFRVQLTRRLVQQRVMMAADQRPSFRGVATTSDAGSEAGVNIASKAIDYLLTEAKLEQKAAEGLSASGFFGEGGLHIDWDYAAGKMVPAQEPMKGPDGQPVQMPVLDDSGQPQLDEMGQPQMQTQMQPTEKKSGAPKIDKLYAWQIVKDPYLEDDHPWMIIKLPVNKHELAAKFPEKANQIRACTIDTDMGDDALFAWGARARVSSDTVVLRILYHRNCEAVPGGRWSGWLGKDVGLWGIDGEVPCPLDEGIPVKTMIADRYFMTAFGYAETGDLLSVQTAINELFSQALTNVQKFGNPNMYKNENLQLNPASVTQGGHLFDLPQGIEPPVITEYQPVPPITPQMWESLIELMDKIAGSNSVVGGDPKANITSGAFAVLLVNIAQKFASALQQAYDFAITAIANDALELVRKNATNGFMAEIAGEGNQPYLKLMTAQDIAPLRSIKIERQNPVMATFVGRMEVFNATKDLLPQQRAAALEMLLNSDLEAYADNDQSAAIKIRYENEQMLKGIKVEVQVSDNDLIEGPKHVAQLNKLLSMPAPAGERLPVTDSAGRPVIDPMTRQPAMSGQWSTPERQQYETAKQLLLQHIIDHSLSFAGKAPPVALVCGAQPNPMMMAAPGAPGAPAGEVPPDNANDAAKQPEAPSAPKPPEAPQASAA